MLSVRTVGRCIGSAIYDTVMHDGVEHAGYLAFMALLAFCPFLVLLMTVLSWVGDLNIGPYFTNMLLEHMPVEVAAALEPRARELAGGPPQGLMTIAIIGAVWTSSSTVEGLRTMLNRAYRVHTPPAYLLRRALSIIQFLIFTAVVLLTLLLVIVGPVLWARFQALTSLYIEVPPQFALLGYLIPLVVLFAVVSAMYYYIPNIRQRFVAVIPGAVVVVALWMVAASLFSFYLSHVDQVNVVYGSLEGIIVTLFFFFLMSLLLIFGAELNYHLEKAMGHRLLPREKTMAPPPDAAHPFA